MRFYIAQTTKPSTTTPLPTQPTSNFSIFLPILTTILGLIGGILIARYSSYLTNQREKVKKEKERLDEVENMEIGAQILEAVSKSHSDLTNTINEQGRRLNQEIHEIKTAVEANTTALAVLKNTVEERIPRRPIEIAQ